MRPEMSNKSLALAQTIRIAVEELRSWRENEEDDLGLCPYFNNDPDGTCTYGCLTEPECVTCEPADKWPSQSLARLLRSYWRAKEIENESGTT